MKIRLSPKRDSEAPYGRGGADVEFELDENANVKIRLDDPPREIVIDGHEWVRLTKALG